MDFDWYDLSWSSPIVTNYGILPLPPGTFFFPFENRQIYYSKYSAVSCFQMKRDVIYFENLILIS